MSVLKQIVIESDFDNKINDSILEDSVSNIPLGSPNRNFIHLDEKSSQKIDYLYEKMASCGSEFREYLSQEGEHKVLPVYCDNRSCDKPECKEHRLYKYRKEHQGQINVLNKSMRKPKGWVFSGWKIPINELDRTFCRKKLVFLFNLLKVFSVSEFSVHMEIKVYPKTHKDFGMAYLHFHVVSGGLKDLHFIRKKWGRQIKYETAIRPKSLGYYVSKYASKTPIFDYEPNRWYYHLLVYKTQMHRFSCKPEDSIKVGSEWVCLDVVLSEVKRELYRYSYLNPANSLRRNKKGRLQYFKILESPDKEREFSESVNFRWYNPKRIIEAKKKNHILEDFKNGL
ncbi:MAG: hypothetical protein BV457_01945 [Thermoplasmata archaeon M9B1D]|nr:MAG: hypothetical protein BV457_01945 [Thermoplasmata archaeon M9B1D]